MLEKLGDLAGLSEDVAAVERHRRVEESEVLIGCAAEDRKRRQRQAGGDLGVDSVGQAYAADAGGRHRGGGVGAGRRWKIHDWSREEHEVMGIEYR